MHVACRDLTPSPAEGKYSGRLKRAEKAVLRAKDLVQQLLTFSKGGIPVKKAISIVDVIRDTAIFTLRGSKTKCEFHIPNDLWIVDVDKGQISQVISNVTLNAEQAMAKGGIIYIHAENIKPGTKNALGLHAGKYVKISIEDRGCGIAEEYLSKIFDPYFTTKNKGTGLGLSTSYSIVKKHGGSITVDTMKKVGTTFSIYLPASKKTPSGAKTSDKELLFGKGKVLVVDDEESVRQLAADILRHCGYEPVLAEEGGKAIELYKQEQETGKPFDLVLMDLTIPGGMGGKEAVMKLLKIDSKAKIIVASGYSNDPIMANFKKYGFHDAIAKPFKIRELSRVVYNAIMRNDG
jgi:CheY-like chemotaxis protein